MKTNKLFPALALGLLLAGCSNEESFDSTPGSKTLKAEIEEYAPSTRVGFTNGNADFFWTANDQIGTTTKTSSTSFSGMTLTSGAGEATGTFKGNMSGTPAGYAVYPYVESGYHKITSDGQITYKFPDSYTYAKLDTRYPTAEGKTCANSFNAPMWATVSDGKALFKHLGGVFAIEVKDLLPVASDMQFIFTTSNRITGTFSASLESTEPALATEASETGNSVTITFSNTTENGTGYFYIPVPTGVYESVNVLIKNGATEVATGAWSNITVSRRTIKRGRIGEETLEGGEASTTKVESVSQVAEALGNSNDVTVENVTSTTGNEILMPSAGLDDEPISLSFQAIASGATISLTDNNDESNHAASNLTVSVPETPAGNIAPTLIIDMEYSTVTLAPRDGTATYDKAVSTTKPNTLILNQGVTINTLDVKGGNVRMKKGSKIGTVNKDAQNPNATVYVILEEGAEAPATANAGCAVISAAVFDMMNTFAEGGTCTLDSDASIIGAGLTVPAGKNVTLDLNGHTLTAANGTPDNIMVLGTFTLKDSKGSGKIVSSADYGAQHKSTLICINGENAKMNMESGYIYAVRNDAANQGQFGVGVYDGGDFTMTGGKIEAGWYAVCGNGNYKTQNSLIDIKGGELVSTADYAVYLPQSGTTTISGGQINGATGGVCIQRGTLNISGDANILSQGNGSTGDWSDGTGNLGNSALNINGGYGACTVNISGGTFTSVKDAVLVKDDKNTLDINVTGGTFSDPSVLPYIGENANVKFLLNGDKTIPGFKTVKGQTVTFDLNSHTLTLKDPTVGSSGTETNSCQLLQGSAVTFKNGTLTSDNTKIMIQNYCNLTLDKMTVNGTKALYVVSNNCGDIMINNTTLNAGGNSNQFAFDVCGYDSYPGVAVTVKGSSVINGKVEISKSASNKGTMALNIEGGEFKSDLVVDSSITDAASIIHISGNPTFAGSSWNNYLPTAQ